jgi:hypothetical protein
VVSPAFLQTYGSAIKQERDRAVAQNTLSMKRLQAEKHLYVTEVRVVDVSRAYMYG